MSAGVVVSLARREDIPVIAGLLAETDSPFDPERELTRPYARLWVARPGAGTGGVAGFLLAWHAADELHLIDLVVAPSARRQGFGRALVNHLIEHARGSGARVVLLEVRKSNAAAVRLYEGAGFIVAGERPRYYSDGEDALEMRLELC